MTSPGSVGRWDLFELVVRQQKDLTANNTCYINVKRAEIRFDPRRVKIIHSVNDLSIWHRMSRDVHHP